MIQKPANPSNPAPAKASAPAAHTGKTASNNASEQGHKVRLFQAYMSADGRPKEAFHPYRDLGGGQAPSPSNNLLARRGIARPASMAPFSVNLDKTRK